MSVLEGDTTMTWRKIGWNNPNQDGWEIRSIKIFRGFSLLIALANVGIGEVFGSIHLFIRWWFFAFH